MQGDARVIEYLNRGLRHELAAINQYWLHYRLLDNWGYRALAKQWRKEAKEEMEHADWLIERILFLEGLPNLQDLGKLLIGENVQEIIDCDLKMEQIAVPVLRDAIEYAEKVRDYGSRDVFNKILHSEEEHIDWLETQLDQISQMGIQNYIQLQSKANGSQALE